MHDGTAPGAVLLPGDGFRLLSADGMVEWKSFWDDLARQFAAAPASGYFHWALWHLAWLPIASSDEMRQVFALATRACFGGPANQVVHVTSDDRQWTIVAGSLDEFAGQIVDAVARGWSRFDLAAVPRARVVKLVDEHAPERFEATGVPVDTPDPPSRPGTPSARAVAAEIATARGEDTEAVLERLREQVQGAAAETFPDYELEASLEGDDIALHAVLTVGNGPAPDARDVSLQDAHKVDPGFEVGDQMLIQLFYLGTDEDVQQRNAVQPIALRGLEKRLPQFRARYAEVLATARRTG